jgi:hypothetical protein
MKKYKLICMSFGGDYVTEHPVFETIDKAWEYSNDLGSKWYFYPFHFVVTESGKTVRDMVKPLKQFKDMRIKTVKKMFKNASEREEAQGMDLEEFLFFV